MENFWILYTSPQEVPISPHLPLRRKYEVSCARLRHFDCTGAEIAAWDSRGLRSCWIVRARARWHGRVSWKTAVGQYDGFTVYNMLHHSLHKIHERLTKFFLQNPSKSIILFILWPILNGFNEQQKLKFLSFFETLRSYSTSNFNRYVFFLFAKKPFWSPVARYKKLHRKSIILKMKIRLFSNGRHFGPGYRIGTIFF